MNPVAIKYIWQAIQESERSDELRYMNGVARWMVPARSDVVGREAITVVVTRGAHAPRRAVCVVRNLKSILIEASERL